MGIHQQPGRSEPTLGTTWPAAVSKRQQAEARASELAKTTSSLGSALLDLQQPRLVEVRHPRDRTARGDPCGLRADGKRPGIHAVRDSVDPKDRRGVLWIRKADRLGWLAEAKRARRASGDHATSDCASSDPMRITIEAVAGTRLSSDGSSFFTAAPLKYVCATYAASDLFWAPPWPLR